MADIKNDHELAQAFAMLSKAAARKKVYSRKAAKGGQPETAHFLRAMSASESIQARRLFNSMIGKIDTSDEYLTTLFTEEVQAILDNYSEFIANAEDEKPALLQVFSQLRAAETRLRSFYSPDKKDITVNKEAEYYVCKFCGYLTTDSRPEKCPVCGASKADFHKIN